MRLRCTIVKRAISTTNATKDVACNMKQTEGYTCFHNYQKRNFLIFQLQRCIPMMFHRKKKLFNSRKPVDNVKCLPVYEKEKKSFSFLLIGDAIKRLKKIRCQILRNTKKLSLDTLETSFVAHSVIKVIRI